jgi:hypothetical protein
VRAWLDRRPEVFEDPRYLDAHYVCRYCLCGYPNVAFDAYERRRADPAYLPYSSDVCLAEDKIVVAREEADAHDIHITIAFLDWIMQRFPCRVVNDQYDGSGNGRDYTDLIREIGAAALYREELRQTPLPWSGTLIPIGFYWELDHGDPGGPGLNITRQAEAGPDDEALARYLEAGAVLHRVAEPTRDMIDTTAPDLPPPHTLTDGLYMWPADLPYYLRRYHVRLPRAFVLRAKDHGWTVPPVDVATLPPFKPYRDPADFAEA